MQAKTVKITGKVISETMPTEIVVLSIIDGETSTIASSTPSKDGSIGFIINPDYEGFYLIGGKNSMEPQFPIYLKGGESIQLTINDLKIQYEGRLSAENKILSKWVAMSETVKNKSHHWMKVQSTYKDFFPDLQKLVDESQTFASKIKTKNKKFNTLMKEFVRFSTEYYAIHLLLTPRAIHPQKEDLIPFYDSIKYPNHFPNNDILQLPNGLRFLTMYVSFAAGSAQDTDSILSMLGTDLLKGKYLSARVLGRINNYDQFLDFKTKYKQYFNTPELTTELEDVGAKLYKTKPGTAAANFTYPDINGKKVSLSDFKGKVVLVDVWATWCGPCKQQIPFMQKLEKELHGKDVVFLSVSVDKEQDKEKWKNMIIDEQLGGIHIFASGWESSIVKDYKIKGIPRFMLFDKNGNVITVNAPRPSEPALKELILKYLNN
jgi:thiol-disulfide isomerase/thioredoxin